MRRNSRISKKRSVMISSTVHFGSVLLLAFAMVVIYLMVSSSSMQRMQRIGECERELKNLELEFTREQGHWQAMITPEKLERALLAHGLSMRVPRQDQQVRINAAGKLQPGQYSVTMAKKRRGEVAMVQKKTKGR